MGPLGGTLAGTVAYHDELLEAGKDGTAMKFQSPCKAVRIKGMCGRLYQNEVATIRCLMDDRRLLTI